MGSIFFTVFSSILDFIYFWPCWVFAVASWALSRGCSQQGCSSYRARASLSRGVGFSSRGAPAQWLQARGGPPRTGVKPVPPEPQGRFFTAEH